MTPWQISVSYLNSHKTLFISTAIPLVYCRKLLVFDSIKFRDDYVPAPGIEQFLCGTSSVMATSALEVGVEIMASADIRLIREKSNRLGELFFRLVDQECSEYGFSSDSPRDTSNRGSHASIAHPEGYAIMQALIALDYDLVERFLKNLPEIVVFQLDPISGSVGK